MGINEQDLLQLECLLHLQFYQQRFKLKLRKWSNRISEVHKTLRTSLTILLSSSKQKLLNQTLSGISVRRLLQTPFYMWNYFLIAQILIQSIRRKHQKPVLRTKTMVVQKGTACNVGITANKITPKPFQQPTVPFWLPSTTPVKRLVAHVIDLTVHQWENIHWTPDIVPATQMIFEMVFLWRNFCKLQISEKTLRNWTVHNIKDPVYFS